MVALEGNSFVNLLSEPTDDKAAHGGDEGNWTKYFNNAIAFSIDRASTPSAALIHPPEP
jgi:hypothetical protein